MMKRTVESIAHEQHPPVPPFTTGGLGGCAGKGDGSALVATDGDCTVTDSHANQALLDALAGFITDEAQHRISLSGTGAVYRLEKRFASIVGQPHALGVCNATMGLWAIFLALGIRDADVITTPYSWGGSLAGLLHTGNRPVFADIDRESLTLDPGQVSRAITKRTKAILAVDIYGYPCDGAALREIADQHGLWLIQDCAQSFGAFIEKRHTGWWADASVFSFTAGKPLWGGEGGMIVSRHRELYERLIWQTQHPLRQLRDLQAPNEMALNLRMHPLSAVMAEAGFSSALKRVEETRQTSIRLLELLKAQQVSKTTIPASRDIRPSFHILTCEPSVEPADLERVLAQCHSGYTVSTAPVAEPLYAHETYASLSQLHGWAPLNPCPVAEEQSRCRIGLSRVKTGERSERWSS